MIIKECKGHELSKSKPNSPEEFFNRSEVVYESNGTDKTFQVTYLRYFDERYEELVSYPSEPLFYADDREVFFKDTVALVCLLNNKDNEKKRRIYISDFDKFAGNFKGYDREEIETILKNLGTKEIVNK